MKETIKGINIRYLFSRNLKRLRGIANISQIKLAAEAGLTHNFINDIENGKKWVSAETIAKLAIALKAEPYQFFIAESKWKDAGAEIFSLYLDDLSDSFAKMIKEYRSRYLAEKSEDEKPATPAGAQLGTYRRSAGPEVRGSPTDKI
jgi:transcriptional regulator with XRE-family HTH domain